MSRAEEDEVVLIKRQKLSLNEAEEDGHEEKEYETGDSDDKDHGVEEENAESAEPEPVKDPRRLEVEELAKEFGETGEDEIQVVIGPMNALAAKGGGASQTNVPTDGNDPTGIAKSRPENRPAIRFSGASRTAAFWQPMTAEMEEARRAMSVTTENYAQLLNPGGRNGKRRSALEDDLNEIEYPKWRDDGAVESDFFNYGLNEQTWKEYAARQVALRLYRMEKAQHAHNNATHELDHD